MAFPFENLDVYQKALDFVKSIDALNSALKGKGSYSIIDQLSHAALSIPHTWVKYGRVWAFL
jgi:hypothetical protein